jgi:hypothetical protein
VGSSLLYVRIALLLLKSYKYLPSPSSICHIPIVLSSLLMPRPKKGIPLVKSSDSTTVLKEEVALGIILFLGVTLILIPSLNL